MLAHSLSVLTVQLEAARLTAITEAAGANLVGQITSAHKLTRIGVLNARRALAMLRDDEPPGPRSLPGLVSEMGGGGAGHPHRARGRPASRCCWIPRPG